MVSFALFLVYYYILGMNPLGGISWLSFWVPLVFIYLGMKYYRMEEKEGYLTYGEGFRAGVIITFIYASLSGMLIYLLGWTIDPGFVELYREESLMALAETKEYIIRFTGREEYETALKEIENVGVGSLAFGDFANKSLGGFVLSLIIAAFMRKPRPVFEDTNNDHAS